MPSLYLFINTYITYSNSNYVEDTPAYQEHTPTHQTNQNKKNVSGPYSYSHRVSLSSHQIIVPLT